MYSNKYSLFFGCLSVTVYAVFYTWTCMEEMDLYEHGETVQAFIRQVDVTEKTSLKNSILLLCWGRRICK